MTYVVLDVAKQSNTAKLRKISDEVLWQRIPLTKLSAQIPSNVGYASKIPNVDSNGLGYW